MNTSVTFRLSLLAAIGTGLVVGLTHLYAYLYEWGLTAAFDIPSSFIAIELGNVILALGRVLLVLFFVVLALNVLWYFVPQSLERHFLPTGFSVALVVVHLYIYGEMWKEWIWILVGALAILAFHFGWPLLAQRGRSSYIEKLQAQALEDASISDPVTLAVRFFTRHFGSASLILLMVILLGCFISFSSGRSQALRQSEFLVLQGESTVVLRHYGDRFIVAPFNPETAEIERTFSVIKEDDDPRPVFTLKEVGRLRPESDN